MGVKPVSDRRGGDRLEVASLQFKGLTSIDHMTQVARTGLIIDASTRGFLLRINRDQLAPKALRQTLSLQEIEGDQIYLTIVEMNLEIGGKVTRTKRISKDVYEVAIDFSADAPDYWREALLDSMTAS
jgi:hypothetical protein